HAVRYHMRARVDQAVVPRVEQLCGRTIAQHCVPLLQDLTIALQRRDVAGAVERKHDVEKAPALTRRSSDHAHIGRRENDDANATERIAQPFGLCAIQRNALATRFLLVRSADLAYLAREHILKPAAYMKSVGIEAHQLFVVRAAKRPKDL